MKQIWLSIVIICDLAFQSYSQTKHFNMLTNEINFDSLKNHVQFNFSNTTPSSLSAIDSLNMTVINNYDIKIFLGTWCSDSQELVPIIDNYLKSIGYQNIYYYGLDELKQSSDKQEETYKIEFVPTVIFIDKLTGEEKGRIVERFSNNIETDIQNLLN